jgi:hypothetical protein
MPHFGNFVSRMGWGIGSLLLSLIILFAVLHILRTSQLTGGNVIGNLASWAGAHATNY